EALGLVGGRVALRAVLSCAAGVDAAELPALITAVGRAGPAQREAREFLWPLLSSADPRVCEAAVLALARVHHPQVAEAAARLVKHEDAGVRRAAVSVLDGQPAAVTVLEGALLDGEPTVVSLARAALAAARAV
ncbi:MAG: HEAT repeat domain-containing protein, partial [Myxococcota bacterium]